ncbi:sialic acidspecific 9-O-acetylesterase [Bifidobacterium tissieri]|uniref:Sialic acidspecific 9-O-acetylesterase n=1 Tax=Bifidobacterium tissieri TaxID=1630162 RepID=A0A261FDW0_9BIFI|nr:sialate O-acetylesterase [Bifidobacterium tissieri]OZG57344.1 sialic acidspecific 9-O-acetylesterase [Bifidobacterium tissieri]
MTASIITGPAPGSSLTDTDDTTAAQTEETDRSPRNARTHFTVAAVFSDHMVLQRHRPIAVFGTATPGTPITASILPSPPSERNAISHAPCCTPQETATVRTTTEGRWLVALPAMGACAAPHRLTVTDGTETVQFDDVLIGEVWLAGGQSNMELELRNSLHPEAAVDNAHDPLLRFYNTPKTGAVDERAERKSGWSVCTPQSAGVMSAVAYYFANRLRAELAGTTEVTIPVGIVDCYIGGTSITCWMSRQRLETSAAGREYLNRYDDQVAGRDLDAMRYDWTTWQTNFNAWNANIDAARTADPDVTWETLNAQYGECPWPPPMTPFSQYRPCGAFEAMVSRVAPYTVRGVMWYQGEEDEAYCERYRTLLGDMIDEWRGLWNDRLPFLIVQLPRWIAKSEADAGRDVMHWPVIRAAQMDAARTIPDVHIVVTLDCGEFDNIHPLDKKTVGDRLAAMALRRVYGNGDNGDESDNGMFTGNGPVVDGPESTACVRADGNGIIVIFRHADGLHFGHYNGDDLGINRDDVALGSPIDTAELPADASGFALSGGDGVWHAASARILADDEHDSGSGNDAGRRRVQVWSTAVPEPCAVRYGWFSWGPAPLFNDAGLPAEPFTRER